MNKRALFARATTAVALLGGLAVEVAHSDAPAHAATPSVALYLPVPQGATVLAGGPHPWSGGSAGTQSTVDIGPPPGGEMAVSAAAAGTAHVYTYQGYTCWVAIDHADGWQTRYYHLKNIDTSIDGQPVAAGRRIGDAGQPRPVDANGNPLPASQITIPQETCGSGTDNFRHVHFSLWQKGSEALIGGTSIGGYTVHASGNAYCGYWTRNSDGANVADASTRCYAVPSVVNNQLLPGGGGGGTPWLGSTSARGVTTSQVSGQMFVFAQGANNTLLNWWVTPGQPWNGPVTVGGPGSAVSAPSVILNRTTGQMFVFAQGANNTLLNWWVTPGQPWNGPVTVGSVISAPAVVANAAGQMFVFAQGANNALLNWWVTPGQPWNGPANVGTTASAPAVVTNSAGQIFVFAKISTNALLNWWVTPGQPWNGPVAIGDVGATGSIG